MQDPSEILRDLRAGRIGRSEFLRLSAVLGASAALPFGVGMSPAFAALNANETPAKITKKAKYLIGFSQSELNNAWRFAEQASMESEAKARAAKYDYKVTNANSDTNKQVSDVADLIAAKCDLIVITPREQDPLKAATDRALAAGVPVIEIDRTSKGKGGVDFVTAIVSNFVGEGEKVGHWMITNTTGPVNYVELRGSTGASAAIFRHDGFHNVIDAEKRFTILDSQDGDFTLAGGKKLMTNWITRFGPKIDMIYAHNDAMALGAFQAIKEAGFSKKLFVGSIDGEKAAIKQVADGNFSVCVQCDPHYGKRTFDVIDQYFAGAKIPPLVTVADKTFSKENAAQMLAEGF